MSVPLSGTPKRGLAGFFRRKKTQEPVKPTAQKQLNDAQLARLFDKKVAGKPEPKPAGLQVSEIHDRNNISVLRNALYSK